MYSYKKSNTLEYIGADKMGQVPKGQSTTLTSGRAFDVIGNRKVLNYDRQRKSEEAVIEIKVSTHGMRKLMSYLLSISMEIGLSRTSPLIIRKKMLPRFIFRYL